MSGAAHAWGEYWRLTRESAAHRAGGPQDEVLARFWRPLFRRLFERRPSARVLDLACGNGAVAALACEAADGHASILGLDNSIAALRDLRRRLPVARGVAADVARAPFVDRSFDAVVSQFGVEYGGAAAIAEAIRLAAEDGLIALVLHLRDGGMYRENAANLEAIERVRASGLLTAMSEVFRLGEAVSRGKASRPALRSASQALTQALTTVEALLRDKGVSVAGGVIQRLHGDIRELQSRAAAFDAAEVTRWAALMSAEVDAYAERMSAMLRVAMDEAGVEAAAAAMEKAGFIVRIKEPLLMGARREPAAWAMVADGEA